MLFRSWWGGALLLVGTLVALWPRPARSAAAARVYEGLTELEYDRAMEKVGEAEYARLKGELMGQAAQLEGEEAAVRAALARELAGMPEVAPGQGERP